MDALSDELKQAEVAIVQCKQYNPHHVIGLPVIAQLCGIMHHHRVQQGFFVTTARFSPEACAFAESNSITLFDGNRLTTTAAIFASRSDSG